MTTPKAFANSSPRLERSDNLGIDHKNNHLTLKGFANHLTLSGLNGDLKFVPGFSRTLEPWAEISERLRRSHQNFKLMHVRKVLAFSKTACSIAPLPFTSLSNLGRPNEISLPSFL